MSMQFDGKLKDLGAARPSLGRMDFGFQIVRQWEEPADADGGFGTSERRVEFVLRCTRAVRLTLRHITPHACFPLLTAKAAHLPAETSFEENYMRLLRACLLLLFAFFA